MKLIKKLGKEKHQRFLESALSLKDKEGRFGGDGFGGNKLTFKEKKIAS